MTSAGQCASKVRKYITNFKSTASVQLGSHKYPNQGTTDHGRPRDATGSLGYGISEKGFWDLNFATLGPLHMPTWISQNPQKLTSQHHRNTRLWSLITYEHAAKSWGSTTSISLSYRLAKSKAPTLASLQIAEWRSTTRTARSTVRRSPPPTTTTTRTRNRTRRDTSRPTTRLFCGCRCRWSRWRGAPTLSP